MDFALVLLAELQGDSCAQAVQLGLEYQPVPPFRAGHPNVASPSLVERYRATSTAGYDLRKRLLGAAIERRGSI